MHELIRLSCRRHALHQTINAAFERAKLLVVTLDFILIDNDNINRELKQPRRRRQQKPHKFAYLTMKNRMFARFARAFFIFDIL